MELKRVKTMTAGLMLGAVSSLAAALELDMHGSMAQGYVITEGNQAYGSSADGSRDLYEVAINGRTSLTPQLLVSGQLMARRAGRADDGRLRVDFAQLDYQFLNEMQGHMGLRLGQVKNPFGLFNDSRDVVFARPGITMPSIYFEAGGLRDLLFSSEGVQLYGQRSSGDRVTGLTLGAGRNRDISEEFADALQSNGLVGRVDIEDFYLGQWTGDWSSGRLRTALSYLGADLVFTPDDAGAAFTALRLDAELWMVSAQWQGALGSLTAEYSYNDVRQMSPLGDSRSKGDGGYLQYRGLLNTGLEWYLRYDLSFSDRNDRDGRRREARSGEPRHAGFSRDHVVGLAWTPGANWGVFAEHHYIDGTAQLREEDNIGQVPERYWQMSLVMLAYRF